MVNYNFLRSLQIDIVRKAAIVITFLGLCVLFLAVHSYEVMAKLFKALVENSKDFYQDLKECKDDLRDLW